MELSLTWVAVEVPAAALEQKRSRKNWSKKKSPIHRWRKCEWRGLAMLLRGEAQIAEEAEAHEGRCPRQKRHEHPKEALEVDEMDHLFTGAA